MPWPMRFGPPPRITTFLRSDGARLVGGAAGERRLVGRIHVGGGRGELGRAGVDALEHRPHAERAAALGRPRRRAMPVSLPSRASEKPMALRRRKAPGVGRQALRADLAPRSRRCRGSAPGTRDRSCRPSWICSSVMPSRIACATLRRRSGVGVPSAARMRRSCRRPGRAPRSSTSSRPVRPVSSERSAFCSDLLEACGRSPSPRRPISSTW